VTSNPSSAAPNVGITDLDRLRRKAVKTNGSADRGDSPAGLVGAWTRFWFNPASPLGLHCMRFLAGLLFLSWLLPLWSERSALFGLHGWVDAQALREAQRLPQEARAPIGWSLLYLNPSGANATMVEIVWWSALAVLALYTLGIATRVTALLTWLIVVSFLASPAAHSEADYLLPILAFYLMIGYLLLGQWSRPLSGLERVFGPRGTSPLAALRGKRIEAPPSYAANLAVRLVQIHFAVIVVTSGLHKLQFGDWWSGVAYWYPLHPPMQMDAVRLAAERASADAVLFVLSLAAYLALAWQLTFPLFAFSRRFRPILLGGAAVAWLGSAFLYIEPTFGPMYALGCLAYLTPEEWRWITERIARPLARSAETTGAPAAPRKPHAQAAG
jgi:hypothetical protein